MLIVYVDDIGVIGNDDQEIKNLKTLFGTEFEIKDLNELKYFCEIEVAISKEGIVISPRKYTLDFLKETGKLKVKPTDTPIKQNQKAYQRTLES